MERKDSFYFYLDESSLGQKCDHKFWYPREQFYFGWVEDPGPASTENKIQTKWKIKKEEIVWKWRFQNSMDLPEQDERHKLNKSNEIARLKKKWTTE